MGAGMPMAVAGGMRHPNRQIVAFVGDGGALMTGNEIATAMQYGVNPILVISDNAMYGTIGMHHEVRYPGRPYKNATRLTNPDFAMWAKSFGAEGITVTDEKDVAAAVARGFSIKNRPVVLHFKTSADQMSAWRRRK
jgi:acetolactate synthase-1/2/3 large subunit